MAEQKKVRGIKFINKTCWRDDDLLAIVERIADDELVHRRFDDRKHLKLTFNASRGQRRTNWRHRKNTSFTSGYAWWEGHEVVIHVPTKFAELNVDEKIELAVTIAHEFWHIEHKRGGTAVERFLRVHYKYGRPKKKEDHDRQNEHYKWVTDMPIRKKISHIGRIEEEPVRKYHRRLASWKLKVASRERGLARANKKLSEARKEAARAKRLLRSGQKCVVDYQFKVDEAER
jgi:hypothetical protein